MYSCPHHRCLIFQPDFSEYVEHLRSVVAQQCPTCGNKFCACCGESYSKRDTASSHLRFDTLFHCSDLQGVIIGMGLYMIDQKFEVQQKQSAEGTATPQKRKSLEGQQK